MPHLSSVLPCQVYHSGLFPCISKGLKELQFLEGLGFFSQILLTAEDDTAFKKIPQLICYSLQEEDHLSITCLKHFVVISVSSAH